VETGVQCFYNYLELLDSGSRLPARSASAKAGRNDDHCSFSAFYDFINILILNLPEDETVFEL